MFHTHLDTFEGLPIVEAYPYITETTTRWWRRKPVEKRIGRVSSPVLGDRPGAHAYRVSVDTDLDTGSDGDRFVDCLNGLARETAAPDIAALVIGNWGAGEPAATAIDALRETRARWSGLRALFLGEMTSEECELSWILQSDISPLLDAFPALEVLYVRGGQGLELTPVAHTALRKLVVETGGLDAEFVAHLARSTFPALTHLELWLGEEGYGCTTTSEDLAPILAGERFPALRHLGLRNAEDQDDIAKALAEAPVLAQLEELDLSLGTLSDEGAAALLASPHLASLEKLDLHHHYMSPPMVAGFQALEIDVDVSEPQEADEFQGEVHRYVFAGE